MISKQPIIAERIRKITGSFSWIDHRLLTDGFLTSMTSHEILLYFFLVLVGDKNGISFYSYDKICQLLKIELDDYIQARDRLMKRSLIACHQGRFQVLELPKQKIHVNEPPRGDEFRSIKTIFQTLME
jgi:hypothetical protein